MRQDPHNPVAQKVGIANKEGWLAYSRENQLFVKWFAYQDGVEYPDYGSSAELFTDDQFLELESLGPLTILAPGASVEHNETWRLFDSVPTIVSEAEARERIWPLVGRSAA